MQWSPEGCEFKPRTAREKLLVLVKDSKPTTAQILLELDFPSLVSALDQNAVKQFSLY